MTTKSAAFQEDINEMTIFSGAFDEVNDYLLVYNASSRKLEKVVASRFSAEDANGDQTVTRDLNVARNLKVGSSGAVGSISVFPATAAKGSTLITSSDNTGDTVTTINVAAQASTRAYTIPDAGASTASFVMTEGTATIAGLKTFSSAVTINPTTNQLVLGVTNTVTINAVAPSASRVHEISDVAAAGYFALLGAAPTAVIGSTPAEIDLQCDISLQTETIAEGGTVSVAKRVTKVASTGAGAITIAAPSAAMLGQVKVIEMISGEHDVTLALTNVQGGSAATTATFSDINDALVLVGGVLKWHVVGESGVVLT